MHIKEWIEITDPFSKLHVIGLAASHWSVDMDK